eukprot:2805730-Pyramimonas_sp.AAC.1
MASAAGTTQAAERISMCEGIDHPTAVGLANLGCAMVWSAGQARTRWAGDVAGVAAIAHAAKGS